MITEIKTLDGEDKGFFNCIDGYGVLRNYWDPMLLNRLADAFPAPQSPKWEETCDRNERRALITGSASWNLAFDELVAGLASPEFIEMLSELTDIEDLVFDADSVSLQLLNNDDYVGLHAGPNLFPAGWRRIRLQVFLSDASEHFGGELKVYKNPEPFPHSGASLPNSEPLLSVVPGFNQTVVFKTSDDTFYGQPMRVWGSNPCKSVIAHYCTKMPPEGNALYSGKTWWRT